MPELPEVETTCRGIAPHVIGQTVKQVIVRQPKLRWRVPDELATALIGSVIHSVARRGKYILLATDSGTLLIHLGMSGNLRIVNSLQAAAKHDHVDIIFDDNSVLRFNDTRRFGAVLWTIEPIAQHPLLASLGVEPLSEAFTSAGLQQLARNRKVPIKSFLMDSHIVVGVGNIYANEALFMAGILPTRLAATLTLPECDKLVACIRVVLRHAIEQGGTTLRDFVNEQGKAGYFQQQLRVYGRAEQPCVQCQQTLIGIRISNRATVYCSNCQQ
jgi:formamidopyrimidine-DNA glycosylase